MSYKDKEFDTYGRKYYPPTKEAVDRANKKNWETQQKLDYYWSFTKFSEEIIAEIVGCKIKRVETHAKKHPKRWIYLGMDYSGIPHLFTLDDFSQENYKKLQKRRKFFLKLWKIEKNRSNI